MKTVRISKLSKIYTSIAFDGCHKIYLIGNETQAAEAQRYGYEIFPIGELARIYDNSCPLRFVSNWGLKERIITQCQKGKILP